MQAAAGALLHFSRGSVHHEIQHSTHPHFINNVIVIQGKRMGGVDEVRALSLTCSLCMCGGNPLFDVDVYSLLHTSSFADFV